MISCLFSFFSLFWFFFLTQRDFPKLLDGARRRDPSACARPPLRALYSLGRPRCGLPWLLPLFSPGELSSWDGCPWMLLRSCNPCLRRRMRSPVLRKQGQCACLQTRNARRRIREAGPANGCYQTNGVCGKVSMRTTYWNVTGLHQLNCSLCWNIARKIPMIKL